LVLLELLESRAAPEGSVIELVLKEFVLNELELRFIERSAPAGSLALLSARLQPTSTAAVAINMTISFFIIFVLSLNLSSLQPMP
jgi:hypothetical protein